MSVIFEAWGLKNNLIPFTESNEMAWEGKSTSGPLSPISPSILENRTELLNDEDGQFYRIRRHQGDSVSPTRPRTEIFYPDIHCQIADWTTLGEPGANIEASKRWYIWGIRLPSPEFLPTDYLSKPASSPPYCILTQAGQRYDTTPADTAGPPVFALHLRRSFLNEHYLSFTRFVDPEPLNTINEDGASQTLFNLSFQWNIWYYFITYVQWSYTALGNMTIWLNNRRIFHELAQPNCTNNSWLRGGGSQKFKNGIYAGPFSVADQEFVMDTRGIVVLDYESTLVDALAYMKTPKEFPQLISNVAVGL